MKKIVLIALIALSSICFAQTKSILFIGNSYTYSNGGVDVMLKNIALAEGDTLETEAFTVGGAKFSDFCNNPETFERIKSRAWDYVVLQEQSQLPAFPPSQVETECYPFAKRLCDSIRANDSCTQILFFMTWGRENGDHTVSMYLKGSTISAPQTYVFLNNLAVDENESGSLVVYPNPAKDRLTIESEEIIRHCEIYDLTGQLVKTLENDSERMEISIEALPAGTYLVKLVTDSFAQTRRLIKK